MKGTRDYRVYLEDIASAIRFIGRYTVGGREGFMSSSLVQDGVIRRLSIIGEAAGRLPSSVRRKYEGVPWKKIVGMRNVLVHDYAETNLRTVWATITEDLPRLERVVEAMLVAADLQQPDRRRAT